MLVKCAAVCSNQYDSAMTAPLHAVQSDRWQRRGVESATPAWPVRSQAEPIDVQEMFEDHNGKAYLQCGGWELAPAQRDGHPLDLCRCGTVAALAQIARLRLFLLKAAA